MGLPLAQTLVLLSPGLCPVVTGLYSSMWDILVFGFHYRLNMRLHAALDSDPPQRLGKICLLTGCDLNLSRPGDAELF